MSILLKKGSKGEEVKALQKALGITADGVYGCVTESYVVAYQRKSGLTPDGIVGPATWSALFGETKDEPSEINITRAPISRHITRGSRAIKYIVCHFTAGTKSTKGNAMATRNFFQNSDRNGSADFVVDDETIVQCSPDLKGYSCWHCGDGRGKYGITNSNSIGIEMCSTLEHGATSKVPNHEGWSFTDAVVHNTEKLVKLLMKKFNVPVDRVVRHYDASRKSCPGIIGWNNANLYTTDGKRTSNLNNSKEWEKFKNRLK